MYKHLPIFVLPNHILLYKIVLQNILLLVCIVQIKPNITETKPKLKQGFTPGFLQRTHSKPRVNQKQSSVDKERNRRSEVYS